MQGKRSVGVLLPIFSLPNGYSVGSFGTAAYRFIDRLEEGGFRVWQTLPFTVTDPFYSPYASPSSFSLNPLFIDLETLALDGLLTASELSQAREHTAVRCEYERLARERLPLLRRVAERAKDALPWEAFLHERPYLAEYCRFEALKAANDGAPWWEFECKPPSDGVYEEYGILSYLFFDQWQRLHRYAGERGISIIGDLPIYVSRDSADVYFHSEYFLLAPDGTPQAVAGVPPDYFSEDGQLWGNPLYRWERIQEDGFSFWRARIRHMLSLFDGVRLDHFRGFDTYFEIPYGASTAREGVWRQGPREALIDALREEARDTLLIAENLGESAPSVDDLLAYSGFPGMRVLSFGFDGDGGGHLPHEYPENTVAYSGTHDNDTLLGALGSLSEEKRRAAFAYGGYAGDDGKEAVRVLCERLYASAADLVIFPLQDLLLLGGEARINTPGRADGNWAFRFTREQLSSLDTAYFRRLAERYGRI